MGELFIVGISGCVDNTPYMTPAQSVENFYSSNSHSSTDLMLMEAIARRNKQMHEMSMSAESELDRYSVVSESFTECSEAPSVGSISSTFNSNGYSSRYQSTKVCPNNSSSNGFKGKKPVKICFQFKVHLYIYFIYTYMHYKLQVEL